MQIASGPAPADPAGGAIEIEFATGPRMRITGAVDTATLTAAVAALTEGSAAMIPVPSGVQVWLATGHTDMRKGAEGLAALVRETMNADPFSGAVYVFRAKRGQHTTFCIQSSKRDNCISVASAFGRTLQVAPFRRGKDLKCICTEERRGFSREVPNWMSTKATVPAWHLDRRRSVLMDSTNLPLF